MQTDDKDDRFSGAKSESYFSSRRELKKHEVTGEAVEMIRKFIFENLTAPTYREMMKSKEYQGVYEKELLR
jgi:hypothetical protein